MVCKSCGEELVDLDYYKLRICRFCYVIDDLDRFAEVRFKKKDKKDEQEEH